jgi:carbonic anhydrase
MKARNSVLDLMEATQRNLSLDVRRQELRRCICHDLAASEHGMFTTKSEVVKPPVGKAKEALERLKEGNKRFSDGCCRHAHESVSWRGKLVEGQTPFATIVGCSDSRVPPEIVFDVGLGELFIVRLAGNIIAEDVVGTLQYAVAHLHTPLVVIMGHESCGAVTAAVDELLKRGDEPSHIEALLQLIKPGLSGVDLQQERKLLIEAAVEANVRWSIKQLLALPDAQLAINAGLVTLVGAVYELETGKVRFLDQTSVSGSDEGFKSTIAFHP